MMKGRVLLLVGLLAAPGAGAWAGTATPTPWVHVRVQEADKSTKVDVNLPLSVVEIALRAAPSRIVADGKLKLHHHDTDLSVADLKRMWRELGAVGDHELVSVKSDDETVRVARNGAKVEVRVEKSNKSEQVSVDVPVTFVDALLAGEGDEIDLESALTQLRSLRGDVVSVHDDDTTVRIWIDEVP